MKTVAEIRYELAREHHPRAQNSISLLSSREVLNVEDSLKRAHEAIQEFGVHTTLLTRSFDNLMEKEDPEGEVQLELTRRQRELIKGMIRTLTSHLA